MTALSTKSRLKQIQLLLLTAKSQVAHLNLPPLGQEFLKLDGQACTNALVAYRFGKKLEPSVEGKSEARADSSVQAMLSYDAAGITKFQPATMDLDPYVRQNLYKSRERIHECLQNFQLDYAEFSFPSGESFDSAKGDVSLVAKLRNKDNWKVTPDCFDIFVKLVYHNRWLKKAAQAHIDSDVFYVKHKRRIDTYLYEQYKGKGKSLGLHIFKEKMKQFVVTLWYGSKITTVPKNVDTDRVIEVEVFGNMIVQRCIAHALIKCMNCYYAIDLLDAQWLHKTLIADMENATIDWSNASNSNWFSTVEWFFPKKVFKLLRGARSGVVSYRGDYFGLNMLSPMGNGFTFEVMTCFLMAIARELDSCAMVFGDDVIIHKDVALDYINTVSVCGWNPNMKKTFLDGPFRESCGGFYHSDVGYITSYEFTLPTDMYDVMVIANKLLLIQDSIDGPLRSLLCNLRNEIINLCDVNSLRWQIPQPKYYQISRKLLIYKPGAGAPIHTDGRCLTSLQRVEPDPVLFQPELDKGIFVSKSKWVRLTRQDEVCKAKFAHYKAHRVLLSAALHYNYHSVNCISVPEKVPQKYKSNPVDGVKSVFWLAYYFRNNRSMRPTIRNNDRCKKRDYLIVDGDLYDPLLP